MVVKVDPVLSGDPRLQEIVQRLVDAYRPERVYLFGSMARGEAGPDSDYDILLVVPDDAPPERRDSDLAYRALLASLADDHLRPRADLPPGYPHCLGLATIGPFGVGEGLDHAWL